MGFQEAVTASKVTYRKFDQYEQAVPMAATYREAYLKEMHVDLSKGVCLGLSFAFLQYRLFKNRAGDAAHPAEDPAARDLQEQWRTYLEAAFPDLSDKKKHTFRANIPGESYVPYGNIVTTMNAQSEKLKQKRSFVHADWWDLYKTIGGDMLPYTQLDPSTMEPGKGWTGNEKLQRVGYHLVDDARHAMAFSTNPGRGSFKLFDPNCGFASARTFDQFGAFLRAFLGDEIGGAWSIYSFF